MNYPRTYVRYLASIPYTLYILKRLECVSYIRNFIVLFSYYIMNVIVLISYYYFIFLRFPFPSAAESVQDLKICCRQAFDASCKLFLEKLSEVQMAKDQATAELVRKKLEVQMQSEMVIDCLR